jgi:hypothetical protein
MAQLSAHVPCARCGYDLYGLPPARSCPECALPILASLSRERLVFSDGAWLHRVVQGNRLAFWAIVLGALAYVALSAVVLPWLWRAPSSAALANTAVAFAVLETTFGLLLTTAVVLTTSKDPSLCAGRGDALTRGTARVSVFAWLLLLGASSWGALVFQQSNSVRHGMGKAITPALLLASLALTAHVVGHARRIPSRPLAGLGIRTIVLLGLFCGTAYALSLSPLPIAATLSRMDHVASAVILAAVWNVNRAFRPALRRVAAEHVGPLGPLASEAG